MSVKARGVTIFIGYRRRDSQGFAGRVTDDLIDTFGTAQVFRDDDIPEGSDFTLVLERALSTCSVLIAVIGPNWLRDHDGIQRLHQPDDWVRQEIEVALKRGIWVLPVLVGNATMPSSEDVPDSLVSFIKVQALSMSDRRWEHDLERLVALLNQRIPSLSVLSRSQPTKEFVPSARDTLVKLVQTFSQRQAVKPTRISRIARTLRTLIVRALCFGGLLLVGWYLFENHTTLEFRNNVFEFLAFAQNKITNLISRVLTE